MKLSACGICGIVVTIFGLLYRDGWMVFGGIALTIFD